MKSFGKLSVAAWVVVCTLVASQPAQAEKLRALYGDGSVRYAAAGPFGVNTSQKALIGLLLPAVRGAKATLHIVDNRGTKLLEKEVAIPTDQIPTGDTAGFFPISLIIAVNQANEITITDGTSETKIGDLTSSEHLSILIGLLLPAVQKVREAAARMHTGSVQITNSRSGEIVGILPFIEQSILAKNLKIQQTR